MNISSFLSLLQFADGLFPTGAYAHSFGLESYVQAGAVRTAAQVETFLRSYLEGSSGPSDAVAALCAWRAAHMRDLDACFALDAILDAVKTADESRAASRQMGRQTLRVATDLTQHHLLVTFYEATANDVTAGHHAVTFGIVGSVMEWPPREMACAYLSSTSAALVGAALRLMPLGQSAAQRVLWNLRPVIERLADEGQDKEQADIWSFAPVLEIAAMRHSTLEARLFRS